MSRARRRGQQHSGQRSWLKINQSILIGRQLIVGAVYINIRLQFVVAIGRQEETVNA